MQCRALDDQKFRCSNDAAASDYCDAHREVMERLLGKPSAPAASRWRGMLAKFSASPPLFPTAPSTTFRNG
jgi:hypothetical protein